jgi:hypothetical protein
MPLNPYLGQMMPAGFGIIPKGWAPCNGALSKNLRRLIDATGTPAGSEIITPPPTSIQPSYRGDSPLRVLDIETLANTFSTRHRSSPRPNSHWKR